MNKFILALATVSALSTAAVAERNYDLRDSPEARGTFSVQGGDIDVSNVNTLPAIDADNKQTWLFGKYGITNDADELRRWNEKNGG